MKLSETLSHLPDKTAQFLADGYLFQRRLRAARGLPAGSGCPLDVTLLGKPSLLVRGREGVELFYDNATMKRDGAMPLAVRGPLFGAGAVHGLDDAEHRHRKAMFVALDYDDAQVRRLMPHLEREVRHVVAGWAELPSNVYIGSVLAYGRAVLRWAGVPGTDADLDPWIRRLAQIVDGFGKKSPAHLQAWVNRARCDRWAADLIRRTRAGEIRPEPGTALAVIADFRDLDGALLDEHTAAVEFQNTTRPLIAVARFAAFAAAALVQHPQWRSRIAAEVAERGSLVENPQSVAFAQEVRRVSPFVPMLPAIARHDFEWRGFSVEAGQRVFLDIAGTNTDPETWADPERFDPERFLGVDDAEKLDTFVPQGGADVHTGHRCPGEKLAVTALSVTVSALCEPGVELDASDTAFDPTQLPTLPRHGVRVRVVR